MGFMFITGVFCHLNTEVHCFGPTPYSSSQILGITLWSVSKPGAQSLRHNLALHLVSAVQKLVIPTFSSGVHVWGTGPALARVWDLETSIHGLISHIRLSSGAWHPWSGFQLWDYHSAGVQVLLQSPGLRVCHLALGPG